MNLKRIGRLGVAFGWLLALAAQTEAALETPTQTIRVSGTWQYADQNGVPQTLRYARVEVWDKNTGTPDLLLAAGHTAGNGSFVLNITSSEADGPDIYVRVFAMDDYSAHVVSNIDDATSVYAENSSIYNNVLATPLHIGTSIITNADERMAFYIYDTLSYKSWSYLFRQVGWIYNFELAVQWYATSDQGSWYRPDTNQMFLLGRDRWDASVILHEHWHFIYDRVYQDPSQPGCGFHNWGVPSTPHCAWREGSANFYPSAVNNTRFYIDTEEPDTPNGILIYDLELPTGQVRGEEVEGAVAAALWDAYDPANEPWDAIATGFNGDHNNGFWHVFFTRPTTTRELQATWFWYNHNANCQLILAFARAHIGAGTCVYLPYLR